MKRTKITSEPSGTFMILKGLVRQEVQTTAWNGVLKLTVDLSYYLPPAPYIHHSCKCFILKRKNKFLKQDTKNISHKGKNVINATKLTLKISVHKEDILKQIKDNLHTVRRYVQLIHPTKNCSNRKYIKNVYKSVRK